MSKPHGYERERLERDPFRRDIEREREREREKFLGSKEKIISGQNVAPIKTLGIVGKVF